MDWEGVNRRGRKVYFLDGGVDATGLGRIDGEGRRGEGENEGGGDSRVIRNVVLKG